MSLHKSDTSVRLLHFLKKKILSRPIVAGFVLTCTALILIMGSTAIGANSFPSKGELQYYSYSPEGAAGGSIVPASCEIGVADFPGQCYAQAYYQANYPVEPVCSPSLVPAGCYYAVGASCYAYDYCSNIAGNQCSVPAGYTRDASGNCIQITSCAAGTHRDASGNCVPDSSVCPAGTHSDGAGGCAPDSTGGGTCPAGTHSDGAGGCTPDSSGGSCPAGTHLSAGGGCVSDTGGSCPSGQTLNSSGVCVAEACSISANPTTVNPGGSTTVTWSCSQSSSASSNFTSGMAGSGSRVVSPSASTDYALSCQIGCQASVRVTVGNTSSLSLTSSSVRVRSGDTVTITWNASNVDSCTVSGPSSFSGSGNSGSSLTPRILSRSVYTLSCIPRGGGSPVTASVTVNLIPEGVET